MHDEMRDTKKMRGRTDKKKPRSLLSFVSVCVSSLLGEWNQIFAKFCTIALDELGTIFRRSENLSRTWEITAMLDALSEDRERERVRTTVTQLLRSGVAPPPKKVAENAAR